MRLHGEDHDIVGSPRDSGGRIDNRHINPQLAVRRLHPEAIFEDGPVVGTAGDEGHIVPMFGKPGTHNAPDASGAKNDDPHGQIVPRKCIAAIQTSR